jgi:hypothetical protein
MTASLPSQSELNVLLGELTSRQLTAQARTRHWRNTTFGLCIALLIVLPVLAIVAPKIGSGLVRIRATAGAANTSSDRLSVGDLLAIELWGMLGGVIGVIAAVSRIKISSVNSSLQAAQLVLKPLAGAAFAIFGVVAIQGGLFNQLQPVSTASIAAYATLFGFAQESLTRLVDRRASTLLDTAAPTGADTSAA